MIKFNTYVTREDQGKTTYVPRILEGYKFPPKDVHVVDSTMPTVERDFNTKFRMDAIMANFAAISDEQVKEMVSNDLIGVINIMANDEKYHQIFLEPRVVVSLTEALKEGKELDYDAFCNLNRIIFSVLPAVPDNMKANYIALAAELDEKVIEKILSLNQRGYKTQMPITKDAALVISINRFSVKEFREIYHMARTAYAISHLVNASKMFNSELLKDLYTTIFTDIESIFIGGMLKLCGGPSDIDTNESKFMDYTQADTVMDILETQSFDDIIRVLQEYFQFIQYRAVPPERIKYSMNKIDQQRYPLIQKVIYYMMSRGAVII